MRYEVREVTPPRKHNPKGWRGKAGGSLITHCVWDKEKNQECAPFGTLHSAQSHCDYYNDALLNKLGDL